MTEIEQIGNYVKINNRMIPAGNIQVEGYPGWKRSEVDGLEYWYGIYFEVAFEDGSLWIVDQWSNASFSLPDEARQIVIVAEYATFGMDRSADGEPTYAWMLPNWNEFERIYSVKLQNIRAASINNRAEMGL